MQPPISRRTVLKGSVAFAAYAFAHRPLAAFGFAEPEEGAALIPFLTPQTKNPNRPMVQWDELTNWTTDNGSVYVVSHYNKPEIKADEWKLDIGGFVEKPRTLTLDELKRRPRKELLATLECGGNGASASFMGAVANVRWTGTPLAPLLKECGILKRGIEVAFFGMDEKQEKVREQDFDMKFSRSLALGDALREDILLCWEMNGQPLPREHGFPLRLVVPGWYGITWVKWLARIEVLDRRLMSKYMSREYVTIRGEEINGHTLWRETSVCFMNVKSVVARVVRLKDGTVRVTGAAWSDGTPIKSVELKLDDGAWQSAKLDAANKSKFSWTFWSFDWKNAPEGEHSLVSRATDADGRVQPAADDPSIKLKKTYWEANQQWTRKIRI
ncbi:MAG: sulfite oxidase [Verrucomicrobia bacterium]|nr:sulfite oxidase [Verrucomicrobiota bacterium]